jgi:hypothetical protein
MSFPRQRESIRAAAFPAPAWYVFGLGLGGTVKLV